MSQIRSQCETTGLAARLEQGPAGGPRPVTSADVMRELVALREVARTTAREVRALAIEVSDRLTGLEQLVERLEQRQGVQR